MLIICIFLLIISNIIHFQLKTLRDKLLSLYDRSSLSTLDPATPKSLTSGSLTSGSTTSSEAFMTQLNALSTKRSCRTRRLALAEDDPNLAKAVKLATLLRTLHQDVLSAKGKNLGLGCSHP